MAALQHPRRSGLASLIVSLLRTCGHGRVAGAVLASAAIVLVSGCSAESGEPAETTKSEHLIVNEVTYNCATQTLTVAGKARPPRLDQQVQVQVRSIEHPRAPVWRIAPTSAAGQFLATGHYVVRRGRDENLVIRLGGVVNGERVFSDRTTQPVVCR